MYRWLVLTVLVDVLPATSTKLRSAVNSVGGGFLTSWARVDGARKASMKHETAAAPRRIRIPRVIGGGLTGCPAVHRLGGRATHRRLEQQTKGDRHGLNRAARDHARVLGVDVLDLRFGEGGEPTE